MRHQLHVWRHQNKEKTVENNDNIIYTEEQLMARLKFFIGICLSLTLFGIVFVVLYSLIFVTQPLNAISPIDSKFFELIIPIATFLTGTLSGIMLASPGDKEGQAAALKAANSGWERPPNPTPTNVGSSNGGFGSTTPTTGFAGGSTTLSAPSAGFGAAPGGFGSPAPGGFGSSAGFGAPAATPAVVAGFGGKPAPAPAPQPQI